MTGLLLALAVALASTAAVCLARIMGKRRMLLDSPNARSMHKVPVPRLGGAAFVPVVLIAAAIAWFNVSSLAESVRYAALLGAAAIYGLGLADDIFSLSAGNRLAVQCLIAAVVVGLTLVQGREGVGLTWLISGSVLVFAVVLLLNAYNFMDGIDGLAGIQAVAGGLAWWAIAAELGAQSVALLGVIIAAGATGFLVWNWHPAKIFMGDAGSTVIGFLFGISPLLVQAELGETAKLPGLLIAGALVVWPFLADATFTILRRLKHRENIFQAHRSHLYQRLVIAGASHRRVTVIYGLLAGGGGVLAWLVASDIRWALSAASLTIGLAFVWLWRWTLHCEARAAARTRSSTE